MPQYFWQRCVETSHAVSVGQSVATLHPHAPLTQADPLALPVQFRQLVPQAVADPSV